MTLVDTSAWIDFFRGEPKAVSRVDPALAQGEAAICGPIFSEVLSGVQTRARLDKLAGELRALEWVEAPGDIWLSVAQSRFSLARNGVQAHVVDLFIAHCALRDGCVLLTRAKDFAAIAQVVPIELELF